ncbi:MAG: MptD family putative ECF transporter S component [Saccharofermentans sp.]|nr:MptD family putative ECF transporter S component [Saccharofermentans sp.]
MNEQQKMKAKDYITCGILSLMNMVGMLLSSVMNISGYTALFYGAVASFFVGILFVIVTCKVPKFGAILIFTIVPCIYFFASGVVEGIIGAVGALTFALLAELILKKNRTNMKLITISGIVYTLYMSVIGMAENFIFTDHYCDAALEHGINETVVEQMRNMYYIKPLWIAVIIATALMTFIGILLGKIIMKKHLMKAGIV